ncbi:MAG: single-stranded DNA-binding protein [Elusimicrobia bacterium]|nr:single-stranded DNA-binding protein [Elusimicrobiota bacterium]
MQTLRLHQLNDIRLVGRLTQDPVLHLTSKGQSLCRMNLAVNRRYKDTMGEWKEETTFVPAVTWRDSAQRCSAFLKKGSPVYVEGRLKSNSWETKDGESRKSLEVGVRRIQFLAKNQIEAIPEAFEAGSGESQESSEPALTSDIPEDQKELAPF